ncbi:putative F-box domain, FBD domain, F-box-like domain superfamily protein [Helianthus annuus]|uniref:F-box domain, FBD domain, F-box-like domain superfamily protein n=2 Tax=Helianthus annuus TaxID=4232 RepID=A0A9K3IJ09_HELAN|nr:putative F-box domain, FBD domain, F-box-like domain superfamily protein [Helianthus annuus]KAJ0549174.1 putative F-box domain, FBD domain, leucine-rich repeat domain superfamily [Helianthus annuus]KAJ0562126.1 putative F-box domain, FBD domain, leucine-rich repeat domain superfamily [Helianthus annuus]KAJ0730298.1 putative F-box domain, FBD domain, leucine-rich repeat domain superfamily [Helianthus annuus]KAJ0906775.1 putative F-box domain, FBD domain, F-box-like domain superfamily protein 
MDRISKLPLGIIENILCLLPTQEAARTSILSKEWRYHWTEISKLEFNEEAFEVSTYGAEPSALEQTFDFPSHRKAMTRRCKLFYAIYQVVIMHQGPIHEFTLSMRADDSCIEIDHILIHLSRKNTVKILKLDFIGKYKLPVSFFSLHQLMDLYLNDCAIDHQPSFNGFGGLTTLHLQEIHICVKELMRLLSSCPLLKRLAILSDAGTVNGIGDITIADFIKCLPGIEYLSLLCLIFLCFPPLPKELPTTMVHLKYLRMEWVWFRHKYVVPFLVLLIRSSPNLEKLKLEIFPDDDLFEESETGSFPRKDYPDIMLKHLTELEILQFSDADNEMDFVKFILAKSPTLKKVRILLWDEIDENEKLQISKILRSSPCASRVVKLSVS